MTGIGLKDHDNDDSVKQALMVQSSRCTLCLLITQTIPDHLSHTYVVHLQSPGRLWWLDIVKPELNTLLTLGQIRVIDTEGTGRSFPRKGRRDAISIDTDNRGVKKET